MKSLRVSGYFMASLLLAACVTVNIYFPAAQAQEAAEQIVDDILGEKSRVKEKQGPDDNGGGDQSSQWGPSGLPIIERIVSLLVPSVYAAQPDFSVNSREIRGLQAQMKKRHPSLSSYFRSGAIGYTKDALVGIRDKSLVSLKQRASLGKLVAAENKDRNQLYQAIANANGHPEWQPEVRKVFAKTWVEKAEKGWWYQGANGQWKQQ